VGEVHRQHPEKPAPLAGVELAEGVDEPGDAGVVLGRPGPRVAAAKGPQRIGTTRTSGSGVLQEHHLELDRVLD